MYKKGFLIPILFFLIVQTCVAPPVTQKKEEDEADVTNLEDYMEYHRYLKEVVNALESDPDFRKKLEKADENEIKSGKIAEELEFVSHHVRTRLDEIKRVELERLKQLVEQKKKLEEPNNTIDEDPLHNHIDHSNPHTFEIEDLKKLIAKTTEDLAEADKKRKEEFKQYELEKEYKKQEKLNHTNGEERVTLEKQMKEMEEKHKKHQRLHEPGHKAQLEEVWEEQDQMQQDFDPKTFFMLHDIDGNGLWDQEEVKALFIKELDKMYQEGAPEDDMRERYEEMERMRESVYKYMDRNQDGFIDFDEFIYQTKTNEFKEDHGWKALDEQKPYTDEELAEYIRQHQANNNYPPHPGYQQVPASAGYPVPPGYAVPQGAVPHPGAGFQHVPPAGYQQVPQGYHQQVPPQGYQQAPPQGYQQLPPQGYQQVPAQGYQQVPQQGYQKVPQQAYPQAPPQGNQQVPPQGQQQVPQQAYQQQQYQQNINQAAPDSQVHNMNTNEISAQQPVHPNQAAQPPQQQVNQQQQVNPQQAQQQFNQQPNVNPPQGQQANQVNQQPPANPAANRV